MTDKDETKAKPPDNPGNKPDSPPGQSKPPDATAPGHVTLSATPLVGGKPTSSLKQQG